MKPRDPDAIWLAASFVVAIMAGASAARSHSWLDPWCCNENDCKPINASEVQEKPDGYHYRQWVIAYKDARISLDRDFYACEYPAGTMRCFYAPVKGM